jgi:membrane fusion protein (multidrug efflux system)
MAEPINVKTGQRQASRIEITEGLNTGDSLITVGVQLLKPGGKVRAISTTSN